MLITTAFLKKNPGKKNQNNKALFLIEFVIEKNEQTPVLPN